MRRFQFPLTLTLSQRERGQENRSAITMHRSENERVAALNEESYFTTYSYPGCPIFDA